MARISGVDLPREKRVEIGLTYIYGIGRASSNRILTAAGVNPDTRVKDLTDDEVKKLANIIAETQTVEGDLRREIAMNIKRLQEIDATEESVIERACRFVARRQRPMPELARVRGRQ
jgi:small subunit ribosomal protein S13